MQMLVHTREDREMTIRLNDKEKELIEKMLSICAVRNGRIELKPIIKDKEVKGIAIYEVSSRRIYPE